MNTVADLLSGSSVFIIFIYHFGGQSTDCRILLERCARRELRGYSSTSVLAEVLHRLMVAEAIEKQLVTAKTAVKRLKSRPVDCCAWNRNEDPVRTAGIGDREAREVAYRVLQDQHRVILGDRAVP